MATRILGDWLTSYLEYVKDTEPPLSFKAWTAISAIAGAMQRKCWTQYGRESVYCNMYIILVGKSGGARKGTAMNPVKDIIKEVQGMTLVAEKITGEKLIRKLADCCVSLPCSDGVIRTQAALTCFSGELSVFIGQRDVGFLASLTDFYDSHDEWKYETKNMGEDHIQGICLNLLGATAPDWMQSMFPQEAIGGGFTSRVVFIFEERKAKSIPNEPWTEWHIQRKNELVNDLNIISNMAGSFTRTKEVIELYNDWYIKQDKLIASGNYPVADPRFAGYCERRATHMRKLMMIMSASRSGKMVIEAVDFQRALDLIEKAELNMHKSFGGLGKSVYSEAVELVLDYLLVHKKASRREIMRKFYRDIDSGTLKIVEEVLENMKVMRKHLDTENNEVIYHLTIEEKK